MFASRGFGQDLVLAQIEGIVERTHGFRHLLGLNHEHLTFKFQGRDFRLTNVAGNVAEKIIA